MDVMPVIKNITHLLEGANLIIRNNREDETTGAQKGTTCDEKLTEKERIAMRILNQKLTNDSANECALMMGNRRMERVLNRGLGSRRGGCETYH